MAQGPDELRQQIAETREEMGETVDAIQERLSPEHIKEQVTGTIRETAGEARDRAQEATIGRAQEAGSGIIDTIRQNPIPAAMVGIGIGWLMSARKGGSGHPGSGPAGGGPAAQAQRRLGETAHQAQDSARHLAGELQGEASELGQRAEQQTTQLGQQAQRARNTFKRMLHENPLGLGVASLGLGAAVGLAIPETRQEDRLMGEARENVTERAEERARDVAHRVEHVAEAVQGAAQQTATEEAKREGLA